MSHTTIGPISPFFLFFHKLPFSLSPPFLHVARGHKKNFRAQFLKGQLALIQD